MFQIHYVCNKNQLNNHGFTALQRINLKHSIMFRPARTLGSCFSLANILENSKFIAASKRLKYQLC